MASVLIGSSVGAVAGFYLMKLTMMKAWEEGRYKIEKHKLYRELKTDIDNIDYKSFVENIEKLKVFSNHHNRNKYHSFLKKEKINEIIIKDSFLFRLKYDPEFLIIEINKYKCNNKNESEHEIKKYIVETIELTIKMKDDENRLDL